MFILSSKRQCIHCGKWKLPTEFYVRENGKLRNDCKQCRIKHSTKRNSEKKSERRVYLRGWYQKNLESERERSRRRTVERPDSRRESTRKYYETHKEQKRQDVINYRARKRKVGGRIHVKEWLSLKEKYNFTCLCCGRREPDIKLELDHVIPVSLGGDNLISNAQPLCRNCNARKSATIKDYR